VPPKKNKKDVERIGIFTVATSMVDCSVHKRGMLSLLLKSTFGFSGILSRFPRRCCAPVSLNLSWVFILLLLL
jgi:hypothetical protein